MTLDGTPGRLVTHANDPAWRAACTHGSAQYLRRIATRAQSRTRWASRCGSPSVGRPSATRGGGHLDPSRLVPRGKTVRDRDTSRYSHPSRQCRDARADRCTAPGVQRQWSFAPLDGADARDSRESPAPPRRAPSRSAFGRAFRLVEFGTGCRQTGAGVPVRRCRIRPLEKSTQKVRVT